MEDWLYANHATLTPASVRQAAADVGGVTDFDAQYPALSTPSRATSPWRPSSVSR